MPKCGEPFGMIDAEPPHRVLCRLYE
jgi:hypothetical protein